MATATATKSMKGFKVLCPECGDQEATVMINLNDLKACTCSACDAEFSPAEAVAKATEQLRRWTAVAKWIELAGECLAE